MASEQSPIIIGSLTGSPCGTVTQQFTHDGVTGTSDPVPFNADAGDHLAARNQALQRLDEQLGVVSVHQPLVDRAEELARRASRAKSDCYEMGLHPKAQPMNVDAFAELTDLVLDLTKAIAAH